MSKWTRSLYQPVLPLGDNNTRVTACERHIGLSRKAAGEGAVLLKNNNGLLPFEKGQKVAVFGKAHIDYVACGGGSGTVTVSYVRNIYEGLKLKKDKVEVFDASSLFYIDNVNKQYKEGKVNGKLIEPEIPSEILKEAREFTDTAIITINRWSSEGSDRYNDGQDRYFNLSNEEEKMVNDVCETFEHVVLLLNVGAMVDTSWFAENDKIEAAFMLWQGGMEGGLAAADLLVGDVNPSGKLVDTCAKTFDDYPSSEGFHESVDYVKYTDDVFVGYRYFETVAGMQERVVYPFGYGLSYTSFAISDISACDNGKKVFVTATVTNTGKYAGKEVVQLYYQPPVGRISKPAKELCAFAKTPLLEQGESCEVTLSFDIADMASYDDTGIICKSAYVMEQGDYKLFIGNSVRNTGVANTEGMGNLMKFGIPNVMTADGPAGVRIAPEVGVCTTGFPVATLLACTWDENLVEEIGVAGALETKENNLAIWLTPALNIHRSSLCGRNFEYYSEDPYISGKMAAAMVRGIQSQNIVAVPKHFVCNNKETNRGKSDSIVSERALREIYLKGFEICVKESDPKMIMTSYNVLNGVRVCENQELLMGILREEWGFKGMVTSDWGIHGEHGRMVKAGNDIRMWHYDGIEIKVAHESGAITRNDMAICAKRILEMILWLE